jgi:cAMP-dependent protein kinase regulator
MALRKQELTENVAIHTAAESPDRRPPEELEHWKLTIVDQSQRRRNAPTHLQIGPIVQRAFASKMAFSVNSSSSFVHPSAKPSLQSPPSHHYTYSAGSINSNNGFNSSSTLDPLVTALRVRYEVAGHSAAKDPLQFCADFFNGRLAEERLLRFDDSEQHLSPQSQVPQYPQHLLQQYSNPPFQPEVREIHQPAGQRVQPLKFVQQQQEQYHQKLQQPLTSTQRDVYEPSTPSSSSSYETNGVKSRGHSIIHEEEEEEVYNHQQTRQRSLPFEDSVSGLPVTSAPASSLSVKPPVVKTIRFALPPMTSEETTASSPFGNFGGFGASLGGGGSGASGVPQHVLGTQSPLPNNYNLNRRTSVSAESLQPTNASSDNWTAPFHQKTQDQISRLQAAVSTNFLFAHLADEQSTQVLGALQERSIPKEGIKVISQGDQGDYFYVVEKGNFDIFVNPSGKLENGPDGLGNKVTTVGPGGSFGELALMYNAPRAATVVSTESSMLWALDRVTFRRILMDSAFQRRRMYEEFLSEVPLLSTLMPYERSKIADALETVKFPAGTTIIAEGAPGEDFFLLESGTAEVYKDGEGTCLKTYSKGDYFGELALLNNAPRAASVVAKTEVKVAKLGKDGFTRLLGSVEGIMRRADYNKKDEQADPLK